MLQLTRSGLRVTEDIDEIGVRFAEYHCVALPGLLSPDLFPTVIDRIERGPWTENIHPGISRELVLRDEKAWHILQFLVSAPDFLSAVGTLIRRAAPSNFQGRIYRIEPGPQNGIPWHNDLAADDGRVAGLSLNLSRDPYSGGVFEIRRRDRPEVVHRFPNTGFGDAILFDIAPTLEHRVTPVNGAHAKTAFAGWFKSKGSAFAAEILEPPD